MTKKQNYVWYVCYGSNLLEERFLCYLRGGCIPGNDKCERGAADHSLPVRSEPHILNKPLFFSLHSDKWFGSGVAFIGTEDIPGQRTYARRYLITEEQFKDVVKQENNIYDDTTISVDLSKLRKSGTAILFSDRNYGRIMYLGDLDGYPMYTFTCIPDMDNMKKTPLFGAYYDVIAAGLKETHSLNPLEISRYLSSFTKTE